MEVDPPAVDPPNWIPIVSRGLSTDLKRLDASIDTWEGRKRVMKRDGPDPLIVEQEKLIREQIQTMELHEKANLQKSSAVLRKMKGSAQERLRARQILERDAYLKDRKLEKLHRKLAELRAEVASFVDDYKTTSRICNVMSLRGKKTHALLKIFQARELDSLENVKHHPSGAEHKLRTERDEIFWNQLLPLMNTRGDLENESIKTIMVIPTDSKVFRNHFQFVAESHTEVWASNWLQR